MAATSAFADEQRGKILAFVDWPAAWGMKAAALSIATLLLKYVTAWWI
jgi:hypothetical protein